MIKRNLNTLAEKTKKILKSNKGTGEMIAMAMVIVYLVLGPAASVKNIGTAITSAFTNLGQQLTTALQ